MTPGNLSHEASVCAVVVNFNTPAMLHDTVTSFREVYSAVPVVIVDNGSDAESRGVIQSLADEAPELVSTIMLDENIFHGPAMDLALRTCETDFVFVLDSDTRTLKGGFLEKMIDAFADQTVYAVGQTARVNNRGFAAPDGAVVVPVSAYMLIDRKKYLDLPPFIHHGLPVLTNMKAAANRGWRIVDYPVEESIEHIGRGTATRFGYGLGWRSKLDYILNKLKL